MNLESSDSPLPSIPKSSVQWLNIIPSINILGFSLTGYGEPSFGNIIESSLRSAGWQGCVREISYGGLSINALAGLIQLAIKPISSLDIIALELATSFFSLHNYTYEQALPLVKFIANHLVETGTRKIFFLNLFRPDLNDDDCVVLAIREVGKHYGIPILDLRQEFRDLLSTNEYGTTDGIHPNLSSRSIIASKVLEFLADGPWPTITSKSSIIQKYSYLDLVPSLADLPRYDYSGRGKQICAAQAHAGFRRELIFTRAESIMGYCFLYGPETGYIKISVGSGEGQELITFDEHSYYRRIGFRPLDTIGDRITIEVPAKVRDVALAKATNLAPGDRCEFICGLVIQHQ